MNEVLMFFAGTTFGSMVVFIWYWFMGEKRIIK